jgi:hypothetical protein
VDIAILVVLILIGFNLFMTIFRREQPDLYVSLCTSWARSSGFRSSSPSATSSGATDRCSRGPQRCDLGLVLRPQHIGSVGSRPGPSCSSTTSCRKRSRNRSTPTLALIASGSCVLLHRRRYAPHPSGAGASGSR